MSGNCLMLILTLLIEACAHCHEPLVLHTRWMKRHLLLDGAWQASTCCTPQIPFTCTSCIHLVRLDLVRPHRVAVYSVSQASTVYSVSHADMENTETFSTGNGVCTPCPISQFQPFPGSEECYTCQNCPLPQDQCDVHCTKATIATIIGMP